MNRLWKIRYRGRIEFREIEGGGKQCSEDRGRKEDALKLYLEKEKRAKDDGKGETEKGKNYNERKVDVKMTLRDERKKKK